MASVVTSRPAGRPSGVVARCSERRHIHWWYVAGALVARPIPPVGAGACFIAGVSGRGPETAGGRDAR